MRNTEGLLWLFSEAKNLFLKVFLKVIACSSAHLNSWKMIFSLWNHPPLLPLTLENASLFLFWFTHYPPAPCPTPAFSWGKRGWMTGCVPGSWLLTLYYKWRLSILLTHSLFPPEHFYFKLFPFWNNFILDCSRSLFWYCNFCIA